MLKTCKCGKTMDIRLRAVVYSQKVEIDNVPIYTCDSCDYTEILPEVKPELSRFITELGKAPKRQKLNFAEMNEWAYLITKVTDQDCMHDSIQTIICERIDQLLDMLLLARSLQDAEWEEELRQRLSQITKPALTT